MTKSGEIELSEMEKLHSDYIEQVRCILGNCEQLKYEDELHQYFLNDTKEIIYKTYTNPDTLETVIINWYTKYHKGIWDRVLRDQKLVDLNGTYCGWYWSYNEEVFEDDAEYLIEKAQERIAYLVSQGCNQGELNETTGEDGEHVHLGWVGVK